MRNIFIEGVRSAFIRIIRMIVYIVLGLIIFYVIGIFTSKKAHALVYKTPTSWVTWNSRSNNGVTSSGQYSSVPFTLSQSQTLNKDYDLLGIQLTYFDFRYSENITINGTGAYCEKYQIDNILVSNPNEHVYTYMRCVETTGSTTGSGTIDNQGDIYSVYAIINDSAGGNYACFFSSEMDGYIFCPTKRDNGQAIEMTGITFYVRNHATSGLSYYIEMDNIKSYYNYDSTEIVQGLTGVQTAQQQTITIIQQQVQQDAQQNQYMQSDNVTSSMTSANNSFTIMTNEITQQLGSANELTQIVVAPVSLFMELATDSCSPLVLNVPFVNVQATIPCMKPIFNQYFLGLYTIFTTAISAIITYWVSVKTFSLIKDILDCDNDRIEVLDL